MRTIFLCSAMLLTTVLPAPVAFAQDALMETCVKGDFDCVGRVLDERLRSLLELSPELLAPRVPPFVPDASVVSIGAPGQTDEDNFPGPGCGTVMRLTVTGQQGALGYMQCGAKVIQCMVTRNREQCTATGTIEVKASGKCGVAATPNGPATAVCESQS